jgi:hypothetical protein
MNFLSSLLFWITSCLTLLVAPLFADDETHSAQATDLSSNRDFSCTCIDEAARSTLRLHTMLSAITNDTTVKLTLLSPEGIKVDYSVEYSPHVIKAAHWSYSDNFYVGESGQLDFPYQIINIITQDCVLAKKMGSDNLE